MLLDWNWTDALPCPSWYPPRALDIAQCVVGKIMAIPKLQNHGAHGHVAVLELRQCLASARVAILDLLCQSYLKTTALVNSPRVTLALPRRC